eukprot:580448-Rhodomonas_salina.1
MRLHILEFSEYHLELVRNGVAVLRSAVAADHDETSMYCFRYDKKKRRRRMLSLAEKLIEACEIVESQDPFCSSTIVCRGG